MTTPPTQPEPDRIAAATYALACVLHGHTTTSTVDAGEGVGAGVDADSAHPVNPDLDLETRLTLAEALLVLTDVHPPYPPITEPLVPMTLDEGLSRARRALATVLAVSSDIGDIIRATRAAQILRALPIPPDARDRRPGTP